MFKPVSSNDCKDGFCKKDANQQVLREALTPRDLTAWYSSGDRMGPQKLDDSMYSDTSLSLLCR